jgi:hypothetical protein
MYVHHNLNGNARVTTSGLLAYPGNQHNQRRSPRDSQAQGPGKVRSHLLPPPHSGMRSVPLRSACECTSGPLRCESVCVNSRSEARTHWHRSKYQFPSAAAVQCVVRPAARAAGWGAAVQDTDMFTVPRRQRSSTLSKRRGNQCMILRRQIVPYPILLEVVARR